MRNILYNVEDVDPIGALFDVLIALTLGISATVYVTMNALCSSTKFLKLATNTHLLFVLVLVSLLREAEANIDCNSVKVDTR